MNGQLLYHIALTCIPNIGDISAKKLIAYCGSSEQVFKENKQALEKIPGIGSVYANKILNSRSEALIRAEEELIFIEKNNIQALLYGQSNYPKRLLHCEDSPIVLYVKGDITFNNPKVISIVGTRKATEYGKDFCNKIMEELKPHQPLIISGLAYGIDICSHKAAINNQISTAGVLAHGLDRLYPSQHKSVAQKMLEKGGLISDYKSNTNPDRENFPKRNRIVAGLSDLTMVIESSKKGGSLITANIANDYNRDVFALPGRLSDKQSEGCNHLIKTNKAHLVESVKDIEYLMGWETNKYIATRQTHLFTELSTEEKQIVALFSKKEKLGVDELALKAKMPMSKITSTLLQLEFKGALQAFPGKMYRLIN